MDKHLVVCYQGGYFNTEKPVNLIREMVIELCSEMKDDAIALVDAMAPPDYVLNSVLGDCRGDVYKNLYNAMIQSSGAFDRLGCIDDFLHKTKFGCLKAKL